MISTCCVQPIDFVKVQLQIANIGGSTGGPKPNPLSIAKKTIAEHGFGKLYTGLDAGLIRQATYTTTRMGVYKTLVDNYQAKNPGPMSFLPRALASLTAGAVGSVIGNPADLSLIRMQSDSSLPVEQRRNYKGVFDAMARTVKEEGVLTLWRGCLPTVYRAMAINLGMLGPYDQFKDSYAKWFGWQGKGLNVASSFSAAAVACVLTLPFDNVKTKFQRMVPDKDGKLPYSGFNDCFKKSIATEGFGGLYVGFGTFVVRIAPHAVITLLSADFLHKMLSK